MTDTITAGADRTEAVVDLLRRAGAEVESTILGDSMGPTLPAGTRVRIRCGTPPAEPGTIVAFFAGSRLVAHRVVRRDRRGRHVIPRGDARRLCDPPIPTASLVGAVIAWWDGTAWRSPGAAPIRGRPTRLVMSLTSGLVAVGLAVHRWVGHAVHGVMYAAPFLATRFRSWNHRVRRS